MPNFLEAKLRKAGAAAGKSGKDLDRYVYGAENNMGAMHGNKITDKGEAMQKKHDTDASGGDADSTDVPMMPSTKARRSKPKAGGSNGSPWGY